MPQYLVSGYLPDNFDPSTQDEAMVEEIHALNREIECGPAVAQTLMSNIDDD